MRTLYVDGPCPKIWIGNQFLNQSHPQRRRWRWWTRGRRRAPSRRGCPRRSCGRRRGRRGRRMPEPAGIFRFGCFLHRIPKRGKSFSLFDWECLRKDKLLLQLILAHVCLVSSCAKTKNIGENCPFGTLCCLVIIVWNCMCESRLSFVPGRRWRAACRSRWKRGVCSPTARSGRRRGRSAEPAKGRTCGYIDAADFGFWEKLH